GAGPGGGRGGAGRGGGGAGRGGGGGGGGGARGGGGAPGGRGGRGGANQRRGPFNGQFAAFGNRKRTQPLYQGSAFVNANNSVLNAAPYSLNGQQVVKPNYAQTTYGFNIGGPIHI